MSNEMRIRRDRSALSDGSLFGRRRRGIAPWKIFAWVTMMGVLGIVIWQFNTIQPQILAMVNISATATPVAQVYWKTAELAYWRGDLKTAIANYREAVKQQPKNVDLLYELSRMLIYHSYDDRRNATDIATYEIDPSSKQQVLVDGALYWAQKAIEVAPNNPRAYTINCFALLTDGNKLEDAGRSCVHAVDLNPNDSESHAYLSATNTASLEEYKKAAEINPQLEFPYFNLAYFAIGTEQYSIAIAAYDRVLSMDKVSVKAYTRLCETYYRMGETELAKDNCSQAIDLDKEYTAAYKWYGQVLYTRRDYEDAITNFETCAKQEMADTSIAPDDRLTECWYLRGLSWYLLGDCDKAMAVFTELLGWPTHDANAIKFTQRGINSCASTYPGYLTPTPVPTAITPPAWRCCRSVDR